MASNNTDTTWTQQFSATPENLFPIRKWVEELASHVPLGREDADDFLTAVDEAVANAIRHGSPNGQKNVVTITCSVSPEGLSVEITDQGKGFAIPQTPHMPEPEATGGRGLPLMCALADTVEVSSADEGTRVRLQKRAR